MLTQHPHVPTVMKSASLNLIEPPRPVQTCTGIALPFTYHLCVGLTRSPLPVFRPKTSCALLISPVHSTCPGHFMMPDFITLTMYPKQYSSPNSLREFFHPPATSSHI